MRFIKFPNSSPPQITSPLNSLHAKFLVSILIRVAAALTAVATNIVLARILGVAQYGHYMTLYSTALILGSIAVLGTDQLLTREFSAGAASASDSRQQLIHWVAKRVAIGLVITTVSLITWNYFNETTPYIRHWPILGACILLLALFALCTLLAATLNGFGASQRSQLLTPLINNGSVLALVLLTYLVSRADITDGSVIWFQVCGYTAACALGLYWLHRLQTTSIPATPYASTATQTAKHWASASRYFLFVALTATAVNRLDVVLVSVIAGDATAGIYVAGARLAQVALLVAVAVNTVLSPRLSAAWAARNRSQLTQLVRKATVFTAAISLLEIIIALVFAPAITNILGPEYHTSADVFFAVVIAYALWTLAAPYFAFLNMTGSEKHLALLSALVAALNITALFLFVPIFGARGAGIAMIVGYAAILPIVAVLVPKRLNAVKAY